MTPVAPGRSVYETLILALRRTIRGVKVLKVMSPHMEAGALHIRTRLQHLYKYGEFVVAN